MRVAIFLFYFGSVVLGGVLSSSLIFAQAKKEEPPLKSAEEEDAAESKKPKEVLFNVFLQNSIERSTVQSSNQNTEHILFKITPFHRTVKKYDVFLILNTLETGVIAEIVVNKVKRTTGTAQATISRAVNHFEFKKLEGHTIIRLDDLNETLSHALLFRANPMLELGLGRSSLIMSSADVITGTKVDPIVLANNLLFIAFLPKIGELFWLNWIGVKVQSQSLTTTTLYLKSTQSQDTQNASLTGNSKRVELIVQPWFDHFFYHAGLFLGVLNSSNDTITITPSKGTPLTYLLTKKYYSVGVEMAFNPVPNFYTGATIRHSLPSTFTVNTSDTNSVNTGTWTVTDINFWGNVVFPITNEFKLKVQMDLSNKSDTITNAPTIGSGANMQLNDWPASILISFLYSP